MDRSAEMWKELFLDALKPHQHLPLLFSGGMDSLTVLAGLMELGQKPHLYTYMLSDQPSKDAHSAQSNASRLNLNLSMVEIPQQNLLADVKEIIVMLPKVSKSAIQCGHPMKYLAQKIVNDGHDLVLCGTVGIVEDNRKVNVILSKFGEDKARDYRTELLKKAGLSGTSGMRLVSEKYGVKLIEPYRNKALMEYQLSLDMGDINSPCQKGIALRAFPTFFNEAKWRRNSPHQVNSGIRELHDKLLLDPKINFRNNKAIIGVYNNYSNARE